MWISLLMMMGGLVICQTPAVPQTPQDTKPAQPLTEGPPGKRAALTDGQLFIPEGFRSEKGAVDLTIHLHGAAWAAERNLIRSGQPGVLVTVVLPGLSDVYTKLFHDPKVFPRILDETTAQL